MKNGLVVFIFAALLLIPGISFANEHSCSLEIHNYQTKEDKKFSGINESFMVPYGTIGNTWACRVILEKMIDNSSIKYYCMLGCAVQPSRDNVFIIIANNNGKLVQSAINQKTDGWLFTLIFK